MTNPFVHIPIINANLKGLISLLKGRRARRPRLPPGRSRYPIINVIIGGFYTQLLMYHGKFFRCGPGVRASAVFGCVLAVRALLGGILLKKLVCKHIKGNTDESLEDLNKTKINITGIGQRGAGDLLASLFKNWFYFDVKNLKVTISNRSFPFGVLLRGFAIRTNNRRFIIRKLRKLREIYGKINNNKLDEVELRDIIDAMRIEYFIGHHMVELSAARCKLFNLSQPYKIAETRYLGPITGGPNIIFEQHLRTSGLENFPDKPKILCTKIGNIPASISSFCNALRDKLDDKGIKDRKVDLISGTYYLFRVPAPGGFKEEDTLYYYVPKFLLERKGPKKYDVRLELKEFMPGNNWLENPKDYTGDLDGYMREILGYARGQQKGYRNWKWRI